MKPLHYILSCSILAAVALLSCSKETETLLRKRLRAMYRRC